MEQKKGNVDLLHGPILKSLIIFMIPIVISSAFQQLYNAVDTAIVGNYLGETALAAIGSCSSVFEMLVGFATSLASGFGIVIARAFGSRDEKLLKKSVATSMVIGFGTVIVLTILSLVGIRPLLELINTPAEIIDDSYAYISVICMYLAVMFAYNLFSGFLRSIGNSLMPLVFLIISSLLNIGLDILFITTFHMGIRGAAVATVVAQGISVVLCILYIVFFNRMLLPGKEDFKLEKGLYAELAGQGFSMAAMGLIVSCGSIILQSGINSLGTNIIAGHIAARKIYAICNLPFISMGIAVSTFIGQNKGANQGERILKAMRISYIYDFVAAGIVTAFLWIFGRSLVHMISGSTDPTILNNGTLLLHVVGPFYSVLGVLMQTRFALQGLGSKIIPLISSCIEFIGKIVFTRFLIPAFGYTAVAWCEPIIWCCMTIQLLISFQRNGYIRSVKAERKARA